MNNWWACPTYIILVFSVYYFNSLESLMDLVQHTAIPNPLGRTTLVVNFIQLFPFLVLVISSLTSSGSRDQDPNIILFPIHNFSECVIGIFILVTGDTSSMTLVFLVLSLPVSTSSQSSPSVILSVCLEKYASELLFFMMYTGLSSLQVYWISISLSYNMS